MEKWLQGKRTMIFTGAFKYTTVFTLVFVTWLMQPLWTVQKAHAEIYQWQDEQGKWHFTNRPDHGSDQKKSRYQGLATGLSSGDSATGGRDKRINLIIELEKALQPNSSIEEAMLAVVTIETAVGRGAGFFINEEGYIVTLISVVRPEKRLVEQEEALREVEARMLAAKEAHADERKKLRAIKTEVDNYKLLRMQVGGAEREQATSQLEERKKAYSAQHIQVRQANRHYRDRLAEFERANTQFNINESRAKIDQTFPIYLANGKRVMTDLITIDQESGLALLRLYGYQTPKLNIDEQFILTHGLQLFQLNPVGEISRPFGSKPPSSHKLGTGVAIVPQAVVQIAGDEVGLEKSAYSESAGSPLVSKKGALAAIVLPGTDSKRGVRAASPGRSIGVKVLQRTFGDLL